VFGEGGECCCCAEVSFEERVSFYACSLEGNKFEGEAEMGKGKGS
jgi:hypothetical protein